MTLSLDNEIKAKFKHLSNQKLIDRINKLPDFKYDDEMYEVNRRGLKVRMNVNTLELIENEND